MGFFKANKHQHDMTDWNQLQEALEAAQPYVAEPQQPHEFSAADFKAKQNELGTAMTYGTAYKMLDRMVEDGVYKKRKAKLNNGKIGWAYSLKK